MNTRADQIEQARRLIATGISEDLKEVLVQQYPELKESKDERIRKKLIGIFTNQSLCDVYNLKSEDVLAYLEKQKEQSTDAKSERVIKAARRVLNNWLDGTDCPDVSGDFAELEYAIREYDGEEKQKEQQPAEWSEEDEKFISTLIDRINEWYLLSEKLCKYEDREHFSPQHKDWLIEKIKSFRPQPHWKPSEEQPECLADVSKMELEVDLEKAAQHVYESWMGGTMNDVCRDMDELGKVLNARKEELPEIGLDKFTEKIKTFQGRYKHPESISVKGAMAFMARMFYQYPNVARQWYEQLPKATMD